MAQTLRELNRRSTMYWSRKACVWSRTMPCLWLRLHPMWALPSPTTASASAQLYALEHGNSPDFHHHRTANEYHEWIAACRPYQLTEVVPVLLDLQHKRRSYKTHRRRTHQRQPHGAHHSEQRQYRREQQQHQARECHEAPTRRANASTWWVGSELAPGTPQEVELAEVWGATEQAYGSCDHNVYNGTAAVNLRKSTPSQEQHHAPHR